MVVNKLKSNCLLTVNLLSRARVPKMVKSARYGGKVKKDVKCLQTCDCYYDPPISPDQPRSLDWLSEGLLFGTLGLLSEIAGPLVKTAVARASAPARVMRLKRL